MKVFLLKIDQIIDHLESESKKLMEWNSQEVFQGLEQTVSGITEIVSIIFENEVVFLECGLKIEKENLMSALGKMMNAMENKDDVILLDALYYEILAQFKEYRNTLEKSLC